MLNKTLLKLENLSSYHPSWTFIENLNIEITKGEVVALVGESGSGKTTFINVLAGVINTDIQGKIFFNEHVLSQKDRKENIGFLLDKSSLVPNLSIAENITLSRYPHHVFFPLINWVKVKKTAQEFLIKYDLKIDYRKEVSALSIEEKKMVEIAKILIKDPQLMVLHEPTNGLSTETISKLYKLIGQYKEEGGTVLYVTKQWEEALKVADRILVMSEGKIVGALLADEAKKNPRKLLNMFLGHYTEELSTDDEDDEVLDAVFKAAEYLTSEYELKDILRFFTEHATQVMNADGCIINLVDEKTNTVIDAITFQKENITPKPELKWDAIQRIIDKNDVYYSNERDNEFESIFVHPTNVKTVLGIPILIRSQVTGTLQVYYNNLFVYSEKEWKYISTLARQVAIAIEDSRLLGRSALLQESHHRIKNNLQSIVSLIVLQKNFLDENMKYAEVENILDDIISRVKSIAAVHDLLSKDELGRSIINLKDIVNKVLNIAAFPNLNKKIEIILDLDDIFIPYNKATTIILIINELVANCYEHAFTDLQSGKIEIKCKKKTDGIYLCIIDNGIGLPAGFQIKNVRSLGLNIVYSIISKEFQGNIDMVNENEETSVKIFLPTKNCF